jgi:hypothetical protein
MTRHERQLLSAVWSLGVVGAGLGLLVHPHAPGAVGPSEQALDLIRLLGTAALTVTLLLGPGIALRALWPNRALRLGFLALPGFALFALTGVVTWELSLHGWVHPMRVSAVVYLPALAALPLIVRRSSRESLLSADEWRVLLIVGAALAIAVAKAVWSLGPSGELWGDTVFRTLEVGDRSDSRISFYVIELVANGLHPFGTAAHNLFIPYNFSARGPFTGLAAAPIVELTGGRPPVSLRDQAFTPFDPEGWASYRIAMMAFASTALLSVWTVARQLAGSRAARLAVILAATAPFLIHEIWFTWPKLLTGSFALLAGLYVIERRFWRAGLLVGLAYLTHPMGLLSVPSLLLLASWPVVAPRLRRPRIGAAIMVSAGVLAAYLGWRALIPRYDYLQTGFLDYVKHAGMTRELKAALAAIHGQHYPPVTVSDWIGFRLRSLANTLIPLRMFFASGSVQTLNSAYQPCFPFCSGGSPGIVHFSFQWVNTLPFGIGIIFYPFALHSLWRALRRWPWAVTVTVLVPFAVFAVYWGETLTGMLREGLHAWVLTVIIVIAAQQRADGFPWRRWRVMRWVLASRALEVALAAMLSTIVTRHRFITSQFWLSDLAAVLTMIGATVLLGVLAWREVSERSLVTRSSAPRGGRLSPLSSPSD